MSEVDRLRAALDATHDAMRHLADAILGRDELDEHEVELRAAETRGYLRAVAERKPRRGCLPKFAARRRGRAR